MNNDVTAKTMLLGAIHGTAPKGALLKEIGLTRRQFQIFARRSGVYDGESWTFEKIARHYGVSGQYVGKAYRIAERRILEWSGGI